MYQRPRVGRSRSKTRQVYFFAMEARAASAAVRRSSDVESDGGGSRCLKKSYATATHRRRHRLGDRGTYSNGKRRRSGGQRRQPDAGLGTIGDGRRSSSSTARSSGNLPGVHIIPLSDTRAFLALEPGRGMSDLDWPSSSRGRSVGAAAPSATDSHAAGTVARVAAGPAAALPHARDHRSRARGTAPPWS